MTKNNKSVLDKPTILDLVQALRDSYLIESEYKKADESFEQKDFRQDERWQKAEWVIKHNSSYLRSIGPDKIDKKNLAKLIDTIHSDGQWHFNMSMFFGTLSPEQIGWVDETNQIDVSALHPNMVNSTSPSFNLFDNLTSSFNCNSVGCIAGFASAMALNWQDESIKDLNKAINPIRAWEHIACNYLNIPLEIGERIFYGEKGSVWAMLKANDSNFYELDYDDETENAICEGDIYEDEWENIGISLFSISYKKATEMLSMILEEEIKFDEDFLPYLTDKYMAK